MIFSDFKGKQVLCALKDRRKGLAIGLKIK